MIDPMDLYLRIDRTEPPTGRLRRLPTPVTAPAPEGAEPQEPARYATVEFSGWLGLLRALSDVFDDESAPAREVRAGPCDDAAAGRDDTHGEQLR